MGSLGPTELIIIGVVLVVLFGASRLPATAKGMGQALKIFKKEVRDDDKPAAQESVDQASTPSEAITANAEPPASSSSVSETEAATSTNQAADDPQRAEQRHPAEQ